MDWARYLSEGVCEKAFRDGDHESPVKFSASMYPTGVNADFLNVKGLPDNEVVSSFAQRFENPELRDIAKAVPDVLRCLCDAAGLREGTTIMDVGCGTGLFLNDLSRLAGAGGRVIATEISSSFLQHLQSRIASESLSNVTLCRTDSTDTVFQGVPDGTVDIAFICDVYHHFEFPKTTMRAIRRALSPNGRVLVIDFIRDATAHKSHPFPWIIEHVRADEGKFRREILSAGFKLDARIDIPTLFENYVMLFSKDEPRDVPL